MTLKWVVLLEKLKLHLEILRFIYVRMGMLRILHTELRQEEGILQDG